MAWQYEVAPLNPLSENMTQYSIEVNTDLNPLGFWDEVSVGLSNYSSNSSDKEEEIEKIKQDTIFAWTQKYMELNQYPFFRTKTDPDFTINLTTNEFQIENVQLDVDYNDPESVLGEIKVNARLTAKDAKDNILMDDQIKFFFDDRDGPSNLLRLRHLFLNPSFKLKFKMTKKPERKRELLEKRVKKYQADILEFFMDEAGKRLADQFVPQQLEMYAATFGIKDKTNEKLVLLAETVQKNINALTAFNKKKQLSLDGIKPVLEEAKTFWENELAKSSNAESKDIFNYNIALCLLFLDQLESAKKHIEKVNGFNDLEAKTLFSGSFNYYLKGLSDAIKIKENYNERGKIYQPQ